MKNIFSRIALLSFAMLALASCAKEGAKGQLFEQNPKKDGVTFYAAQMTANLTAEYNNVIKVPVNRLNQDYGKTTVNIAMTAKLGNANAPADFFTLKTASLTFDKGESQKFVEIQFTDLANLSPTAAYAITLTLSDPTGRGDKEFLTYGGKKAITVTAKRQLTWEPIGKATYVSQIWGMSYKVDMEQAAEAPNMYRVRNMYDAMITAEGSTASVKGANIIFTVNGATVGTGGLVNTGIDATLVGLAASYGKLLAYYDAGVVSGKFWTFSCDDVNNTNYYVAVTGGYGSVYNPGWAEQLQLP